MSEVRVFDANGQVSLNPYSIGRYSVSWRSGSGRRFLLHGLNPYSIGRYSVSLSLVDAFKNYPLVLILILLEDTL